MSLLATVIIVFSVLCPDGRIRSWPSYNRTRAQARAEAKWLNTVNPQPVGKKYRAVKVRLEIIK